MKTYVFEIRYLMMDPDGHIFISKPKCIASEYASSTNEAIDEFLKVDPERLGEPAHIGDQLQNPIQTWAKYEKAGWCIVTVRFTNKVEEEEVSF